MHSVNERSVALETGARLENVLLCTENFPLRAHKIDSVDPENVTLVI